MPLSKIVGMAGLGFLVLAGVFATFRNWRKPIEWHRSMVETTYSWLRIGMPARWAFYRSFPVLALTLAAFLTGVFALSWARSADLAPDHMAYAIVAWTKPVAGALSLVTASVFLLSRPRSLICPALRSQPYLLKVWDNPEVEPDDEQPSTG